MTTHSSMTRVRGNRRGSALILVLVMTLSLAGLAISAIYLSSSAGLLTRYYDKERDYRYAAEAALALAKSRITHDTLLAPNHGANSLPEDTAMKLISAGSLTEAGGTAIPRIRVNVYAAFTGDTVGRFGQFVTVLATAYDTGGTRHVRRLDLSAESFSRYAMFTNQFSAGLAYGDGEFIRGRAHSNQRWNSSGSPGPHYFDTVSAVTTVNGTAIYDRGNIPGAAVIPFPTVSKLTSLKTYANAAFLKFGSVVGSNANKLSGGKSMSGRLDTTTNAYKGTRVSWKPVDIDGSGQWEERDGMMMIFDLGDGIDTAALRVDLPRATGTTQATITYMNQCGLLATVSGHKEFFPIARFKELWVVHRLHDSSTAPVFTWTGGAASDSAVMSAGTAVAYSKILSYGSGFSRCFPAGSPYLMLTERYVQNAASCVIDTLTTITPVAWASPVTTCKKYGGQDSTFSPLKATVNRCWIIQTVTPGTGLCTGNQVILGRWRAWGGAVLPAFNAATPQQTALHDYLWPLFKPYNLNAKGVVADTLGPVYMSDTLRGNVTFYMSDTTKDVVFVDDVRYDKDPTDTNFICRNFLGIIGGGNIMIADNGLNRPRPDQNSVWRFLGEPNATLHMVTMSLTGTVGVENFAGTQATSPAVTCTGFGTSGGCVNQTGGVIEQVISATYTGSANSGLRENRSVDPCQLTNRKPPFFPMTGRYLNNKYYEIDPVNVDTWTEVKTFFGRLRGRAAP